MILNIGRDTNGNKVLQVKFRDGTLGFSVQTNGRCPSTHRMSKHDFDSHVALGELRSYVEEYGTLHQKELLER